MHLISLIVGKTVYVILKIIGRRGATLPGLIVEKIDKNFLDHMLNKIPEGVIIITGTNGKTTSTKMLAQILGSEKKVLTNPTGSNFTRGIVASIVQRSSWSAKLNFDIAVFELDEAYAAKFVELHKPKGALLLNVMRDQMDRFGEIDHTARLLKKVAQNTTDFIILNSDDIRIKSIANDTKTPIFYFGVADNLRKLYKSDDELHGVVIAGKKPKLTAELKGVNPGEITVVINSNKTLVIPLSLHGTYNAQNACAVIATALVLKIDVDIITTQISSVKAAFGRGEIIKIGQKKVVLQLVKNPGGFRHSLIGFSNFDSHKTMIAINDDYADGRDVSWLWDVNFGKYLTRVDFTSGTRAYDMALRLAYDDIPTNKVILSLKKALNESLNIVKENETLMIFTTYTAMLYLRNELSKITEVDKV